MADGATGTRALLSRARRLDDMGGRKYEHRRSLDGDGKELRYCALCFEDWPCRQEPRERWYSFFRPQDLAFVLAGASVGAVIGWLGADGVDVDL